MKRIIFLISMVIFITESAVHAQQYQWVKGGGSACNGSIYRLLDKVTNITTDANKNVYTIASIGDLSINADTFHLAQGYTGSACNSQDVLFASYNCNGQMRFAKYFDGYTTALAYDITYDGAANIYITGLITGTGGSIGTGSKRFFGTDTIVNTNNYTSYLIKYDTSGKMKWLRFLGQDATSNLNKGMAGAALAFDGSGNLHLIATIDDGIQLTPSVISQKGTYDIVYTSAGVVTSALRMPIDTNYKVTQAIFNKQSNALFARIEQFNFSTFSNQAICCLKNNLLTWIDSTGKLGLGVGRFDYKGGNAIYVPLAGGGPVSFSFGGLSGSNTTFPPYDFSTVIRIDTNGIGKWSYKLDGSNGINYISAVTILPDGNVAGLGSLVEKIKHGNDSLIAPTSESINPFLLVVDSSGNKIKLDQQHGGGYTDGGTAINSDNAGSIYLGGYYETTMTATGLGAGISSTGGSADFWLMKYGYTCNCVTPTANYNSGLPSGKTVAYTVSAPRSTYSPSRFPLRHLAKNVQ